MRSEFGVKKTNRGTDKRSVNWDIIILHSEPNSPPKVNTYSMTRKIQVVSAPRYSIVPGHHSETRYIQKKCMFNIH